MPAAVSKKNVGFDNFYKIGVKSDNVTIFKCDYNAEGNALFIKDFTSYNAEFTNDDYIFTFIEYLKKLWDTQFVRFDYTKHDSDSGLDITKCLILQSYDEADNLMLNGIPAYISIGLTKDAIPDWTGDPLSMTLIIHLSE